MFYLYSRKEKGVKKEMFETKKMSNVFINFFLFKILFDKITFSVRKRQYNVKIQQNLCLFLLCAMNAP